MVTNDDIQQLRKAFLDDLSNKADDVIHFKDLERIKKDDFYLKRFLLHHESNQKEALQMMWDTFKWRKEFGANHINNFVKKDILCQGGFFPHGSDKDGCTLFIFKCKNYVKGANNTDDLKKCVIYWFERLEKENSTKPITLFFDMENCGLSNMDMDFTKYLIGLFKLYYPYFLNYILIFEMPWVLSAAFKIIKSWLPEKAVQKIKQLNRSNIKEYVPLDQALVCWGGQDDYVFNFIPENEEFNSLIEETNNTTNKKVHFADGSQMSGATVAEINAGDRENDENPLQVQPSSILTFTHDGKELVSTLELFNTDKTSILSYKLKTTCPEKYRVRPSVGFIMPGSKTIVNVSLLPGFQIGGLSRDKFLIMTTVVDTTELNHDFSVIWKDTSTRKMYQHRLKCSQHNEIVKNGNLTATVCAQLEHEQVTFKQIVTNINELMESQKQIHGAIKRTNRFQMYLAILTVLIGIILIFVIYSNNSTEDYSNSECNSILQ